MSFHGLSVFLFTLAFSINPTTSMPLSTDPNTVCLESSHGVGTVVMKNCDLHRASHSFFAYFCGEKEKEDYPLQPHCPGGIGQTVHAA